MANILNYEVLLSGTEHIQKLLEAEYLSPAEALSVARFSLEILIAHKIEGITPNGHIKKCLVDYIRFFDGEELADRFISLIENLSEVNEIESLIPLDLIDKGQDEIEYLLKILVLSTGRIPGHSAKEFLAMTVISLNKCNFESALFGLFILEKLKNQNVVFSKYEIQAVEQAKIYLFLCMDCTDAKKSKWWKAIFEHQGRKYIYGA